MKARAKRAFGLVAGAVAVVVLVALAAVGVRSVLAGRDLPNTQQDRVFADFSFAELAQTNDGTPLVVLDTGRNVSGLAVVDSALTHGAPTGLNAAGYLEARIDGPVSRIGAVAEFHSENSGAIGLLSFSESLADDIDRRIDDQIPNGGIHFAATNRQWNFAVWDSAANTTDVLIHGAMALPADGTGYAFEVVRYGDAVLIRLPDGSMQATADPRIGEWTGPWAYWELYEFDTRQQPATITAVWAS